MSKKKDELIKLVNDPNMLPGIFNYCDGWCERCSFTSRCTVFRTNDKEEIESAEDKEDFLKSIKENFEVAMELLHEYAEKEGIDLTEIDFDKIEEEEKELDEIINSHLLSKLSLQYLLDTDKWFKANQTLFEEYAHQIESEIELGLPDKKFADNAIKINNAVEMIRWYQTLIHVKLKRALLHMLDLKNQDEFTLQDGNISAKIALIGIERSMAGWNILFANFPEEQNTIIEWLLMLDKLRKLIRSEIPDAETTKRPYFDD